MPYYSGTAFYTDWIYWIVLIPVLILSFWAQAQVNGNFSRYSKERNRRGITGAQAAYEAVYRTALEKLSLLTRYRTDL